VFDVVEDDRFERDGEDLYCEVLVTYPQAVLGADVDVPGVTGPLSLRVPAGTQSGQVFILRGRGLPRVNASGTGDLHVRVQIWTPQKLATEEERLIEQLHEVQDKAPEGREKGFWAKMKEALNG
jgi:molecular chaperone DnaJ